MWQHLDGARTVAYTRFVYSTRRALISRRLEQGLSLYALSQRARELRPDVLGLTHWAFSQWEIEGSSRSPSDVQLEAWAAALGLELVLLPLDPAEREADLRARLAQLEGASRPAPRRRRAA